MATPALSIVRGPSGERHHPDDLIDDVLDSGVYRSAWFHVLYDGSADSTLLLPNLAHHNLTGTEHNGGGSSSSSSSNGGGSSTDTSSIRGYRSGKTIGGMDAPKSKRYVSRDRRRPPEPFFDNNSGPVSIVSDAIADPASHPPATLASATGAVNDTSEPHRSQGSSVPSQSRGPAPGAVSAVVKKGAAVVKRVKGALKDKKRLTGSAAALPPGLDRAGVKRIATAVQLNCYGDGAEDLAAMACRGEEPSSHLGLFPEFSLFNHSCAPNAINYVLNGDTMVVRAATDVKAGDEVTISYMGRPQLTPVGDRLEHLQRDYGFICDCKRCTKESALAERLDECYDLLFEATEETLGPAFIDARATQDLARVADIRDSLRSSLIRLEALFRKERVVPLVRLYVNASLYECYELLLQCEQTLLAGADSPQGTGTASAAAPSLPVHHEDAVTKWERPGNREAGARGHAGTVPAAEDGEAGEDADEDEDDGAEGGVEGDVADLSHDADTYLRSLHTCVKALEAVTCGSDLHAIVSSRYAAHLRAGEESGAGAPGNGVVLVEADRLAVVAHVARYGRVNDSLLRELMQHNMDLYE
ncbi:MAG: hypothetical protein WDW38_009384 [Sanguina aurantia]